MEAGLRDLVIQDWPNAVRTIIYRKGGGSVNVPVNVSVNVPVNVPIDVPINETTTGKVLSAIKQSPGINRTQLAKLLKVDVKTIGRAIAALSDSVEHRGSKKTGGYYLISL